VTERIEDAIRTALQLLLNLSLLLTASPCLPANRCLKCG